MSATTENIAGMNIDFQKIAAGWLRILEDTVSPQDYACLQFGMLPTDLFKGLMDAVQMKLAKTMLEKEGMINPNMVDMTSAKERLCKQVVQEVERKLAAEIVAKATEAGICRV